MTVRANVPFEEYVAQTGLNISRLKHLRQSPAHYRHRLQDPPDSDTLRSGRVVHTAVLEPDKFESRYAVWEARKADGTMAARYGKPWDQFVAEATGDKREVITLDQHRHAMAIRKAVRGDRCALDYIDGGQAEVVLDWRMHGRQCKGRVDMIALQVRDDPPTIVGLKTTVDARPFLFGAHAARLGYHLQWAWYFDGFKALTGEIPLMVEIVVEKTPPHAVAVYRITNDIIEQGREEYMQLLDLLAECEVNDRWPGPTFGMVHDLTFPSWALNRGGASDDIVDLELEAA